MKRINDQLRFIDNAIALMSNQASRLRDGKGYEAMKEDFDKAIAKLKINTLNLIDMQNDLIKKALLLIEVGADNEA